MLKDQAYLKETASQTAGPYVHIGLAPRAAGFDIFKQELGKEIAAPHVKGERIRIIGLVIDGTGSPIKDVLLETWQADSNGVYAHLESSGKTEDGFRGFGRVITQFQTGEWGFDTIKPGFVAGRGGAIQAPHINLWIVARGINIGLNTRLYFEDEDNSKDPVLNMIEWEKRRSTLIAKKLKAGLYRFDIKLQSDDETVFFDI